MKIMNNRIRIAETNDLQQLLKIYTHLSKEKNPIPDSNNALNLLYERILSNPLYKIIAMEIDGVIVSTCTIVIIENLTRQQRPYALIENVVTHESFRRKGYAKAVLEYAKDIAIKNMCYKIFLMTGSKDEGTLNFYKKNGYNSHDKTTFIQWL